MPRNRMFAIVLALAGWFLLPSLGGAANPASSAPSLRVHTASGIVEGVREDGLAVFKGLPYAAPPVGPLRWRAPQPAASWRGVRKADAFGHVCMQVPGAARAAGAGDVDRWTRIA